MKQITALFALTLALMFIGGWAWDNGYENIFIVGSLIGAALGALTIIKKRR